MYFSKLLQKQSCKSGYDSGQIRVILPDPDQNQFQANEKVDKLNFFLEKLKYSV
jgi:hypothetical protein